MINKHPSEELCLQSTSSPLSKGSSSNSFGYWNEPNVTGGEKLKRTIRTTQPTIEELIKKVEALEIENEALRRDPQKSRTFGTVTPDFRYKPRIRLFKCPTARGEDENTPVSEYHEDLGFPLSLRGVMANFEARKKAEKLFIETVLKTACAALNAREFTVIYFGVRDDGVVTGIEIEDADMVTRLYTCIVSRS